ncbi:hypothetical protein Emed_001693 [Eimeria media]
MSTKMSSSPSASPFSVGSDNSTECFRDALSQQMSIEGQADDAGYIPDEVFNFQPKPTDILKPNPGGPPVRLIFGDLDLIPHEVEGLKELRKLMENDKELTESPVFADDRYAVRFLQGNDWDASRCVGDMKRHIHWRAETLPIYRSAVESLLPRGFIYVHGRDEAYRPILVLRCKSIAESDVAADLLFIKQGMHQHHHNNNSGNSSSSSSSLLSDFYKNAALVVAGFAGEVMPVVIYWLEFALEKLLVKNKVEQWRVVIDLEDCSITSAPISILKQVCDTLTRNYRGRLYGMLIVNAGFVFRSIWQLVSVDDFMASINRSQLEAKYGGKCLNTQDFRWPVLPPGPFEGSA